MPTAPMLPAGVLAQVGQASTPRIAPPASPAAFLMAAADMHRNGELQRSAPVPTGQPLQTGHVPRPRRMKVVK